MGRKICQIRVFSLTITEHFETLTSYLSKGTSDLTLDGQILTYIEYLEEKSSELTLREIFWKDTSLFWRMFSQQYVLDLFTFSLMNLDLFWGDLIYY